MFPPGSFLQMYRFFTFLSFFFHPLHKTSYILMELDLRVLSQWYGKDRVFTPISKFDDEKRDFAFVVDKDLSLIHI